jgi:SAM-dependent methyltransferase
MSGPGGARAESGLFAVAAESYDRLMGRYAPTLAVAFADAAEVRHGQGGSGQRALDVGCGPGGLTTELVGRLGADRVAAFDPSASFVEACRARHPGVDVRQGTAESIGWPDDSFDVTLASLVVGFMADPAAGVAEMRRVTEPGGRIALCFWDLARMRLLDVFWRAVRTIQPDHPGEAGRTGQRAGDLVGLLTAAGATDIVASELVATATYADLDDWWSSYTGGAGPVGAACRALSEEDQARVRDEATRLLGSPTGAFSLDAIAWCAVGTA